MREMNTQTNSGKCVFEEAVSVPNSSSELMALKQKGGGEGEEKKDKQRKTLSAIFPGVPEHTHTHKHKQMRTPSIPECTNSEVAALSGRRNLITPEDGCEFVSPPQIFPLNLHRGE